MKQDVGTRVRDARRAIEAAARAGALAEIRAGVEGLAEGDVGYDGWIARAEVLRLLEPK